MLNRRSGFVWLTTTYFANGNERCHVNEFHRLPTRNQTAVNDAWHQINFILIFVRVVNRGTWSPSRPNICILKRNINSAGAEDGVVDNLSTARDVRPSSAR